MATFTWNRLYTKNNLSFIALYCFNALENILQIFQALNHFNLISHVMHTQHM